MRNSKEILTHLKARISGMKTVYLDLDLYSEYILEKSQPYIQLEELIEFIEGDK